MPWVERPNFDNDGLAETAGYVTDIAVEQEDQRDQIRFTMEIFYNHGGAVESQLVSNCCIYLDVGTTVALAQLQLLRDAMLNRFLVNLHWLADDPQDHSTLMFVYFLRVIPNLPYPTTISEFLNS